MVFPISTCLLAQDVGQGVFERTTQIPVEDWKQRGKGKTLQGGMHCCRNYVSEEYGMSDEEAGNLYAAYGFACTGSECVLEATQESS